VASVDSERVREATGGQQRQRELVVRSAVVVVRTDDAHQRPGFRVLQDMERVAGRQEPRLLVVHVEDVDHQQSDGWTQHGKGRKPLTMGDPSPMTY